MVHNVGHLFCVFWCCPKVGRKRGRDEPVWCCLSTNQQGNDQHLMNPALRRVLQVHDVPVPWHVYDGSVWREPGDRRKQKEGINDVSPSLTMDVASDDSTRFPSAASGIKECSRGAGKAVKLPPNPLGYAWAIPWVAWSGSAVPYKSAAKP